MRSPGQAMPAPSFAASDRPLLASDLGSLAPSIASTLSTLASAANTLATSTLSRPQSRLGLGASASIPNMIMEEEEEHGGLPLSERVVEDESVGESEGVRETPV